MIGTEIIIKLTTLRRFAELTEKKIDELEYYMSLDILGKSMARGMEDEIQRRIDYVEVEMNKVIDIIETTEVEY